MLIFIRYLSLRRIDMQEEVLQSESAKAEEELQSNVQSDQEVLQDGEQNPSATAQGATNAEIVEPEAIEGDFVVANPKSSTI